MLKNSRFALKIALLPMLAAVAFVVVLIISWATGRAGISLLSNIETGYYASLESNRALYDQLEEIQLAFQDAAAMADGEFIEGTVSIRDAFVETIEAAERNSVVDVTPLIELQSEFHAYYDLARSATLSVVNGSGGMEVYSDLQTVADQHASMLAKIASLAERDVENVSAAISTAQYRQWFSTILMIVVVLVSLLVLVATSWFIIRGASQSIQTTVDGINALASGNLSQEFTTSSNDEMGHMVNRVTHVTKTMSELANEVQILIDSVRAGKLNVRGEASKFQGSYAQLIENINELIDAFVAPIEVTANYVQRISRGDMPPPIREKYCGDFNVTKENLNKLIATMSGLIQEVAGMTSAAKAGNLDQRGDPENFSGGWKDLVVAINDTLDAVTSPLQEFSAAMSAMAHGKLNVRSSNIYEGDFAELQDDINTTVEKLTEVISAIKKSGDSVSSVAIDIANENRSLRLRTEDQAASLRDTSKTMESMTDIVKKNANNAKRARTKVLEASDKAEKGGAVVGRAVTAMDDINASSSKIADIINVIDEIAFQTNLLALNAAVEAARAGEDGKGFAVVASEVRNLAGRSAMAAKEINDLIKDSVGKVEEGSRLVHESGQTLEEIVSAVIGVTEIVTEISASSQEQTISIEEVNSAIVAMDSMTQKNAELADAAVRASELMGEEANRLNQMTAFFAIGGSVDGAPESISKNDNFKLANDLRPGTPANGDRYRRDTNGAGIKS